MSEEMKVLSNKDQARKRINVFHGSSENWINVIKELIGNSIDIFKKKNIQNRLIKITIHNPNKIEYFDSASGIPVEGIASDGRKNYEAIFEKAFCGSNFDNVLDTVGQNGIFLWTLSMTSQDIEYFISRPNRNLYNIAYHKGDRVKDLSIIGKEEKTYSKMIFCLDKEIWNKPNFTFEEISKIAQAQSSLSKARIIVEDKKNNLYKEFYYENGIEEYFNESTKEKTTILDNIHISKSCIDKYTIQEMREAETIEKEDKIKFDLFFNYSNDSKQDFQKEFLNTADLLLHGTIQEGIYNGLKTSIDKWLTKNNKYKKGEKHITIEDIATGLNYICDMRSLYVEYDNQIKQRTSVTRYKILIKKIIEEYMEIFFIENKLQSELLCNQVLINSRARLSANITRKNLKKKLEKLSKQNVEIEGLTDCNMSKSNVEDRILLVVEGKSPKSTVEEAYDNDYMGALGLRGRFISCLKKSIDDVLNNVPAHTFIQALGCGIEIPQEQRKQFKDIKSFNKDNLKYGNIGILTDADSFGSGIRLALLTFIYKYLPTLLKENRVYIIISPRYEIKMKNGDILYAYNDREKEELMKNIDTKDIYNIGIVKGLGEIDADEFWDKVLKPEVREKTFIQVKYDEVDEIVNKYFEDYMGEDTNPRKQFVKEFITNISLDEIN